MSIRSQFSGFSIIAVNVSWNALSLFFMFSAYDLGQTPMMIASPFVFAMRNPYFEPSLLIPSRIVMNSLLISCCSGETACLTLLPV